MAAAAAFSLFAEKKHEGGKEKLKKAYQQKGVKEGRNRPVIAIGIMDKSKALEALIQKARQRDRLNVSEFIEGLLEQGLAEDVGGCLRVELHMHAVFLGGVVAPLYSDRLLT
jgi:hypothetical protein